MIQLQVQTKGYTFSHFKTRLCHVEGTHFSGSLYVRLIVYSPDRKRPQTLAHECHQLRLTSRQSSLFFFHLLLF